MKEVNERIAQLRRELGLSMEKFGGPISVSRGAVNNLEKGVNNPSEQTLKLICSAYNVSYLWLTEGEGDMFLAFPQTVLDELVEAHHLDDLDRALINAYIGMTSDERRTVTRFLQAFNDEAQKKQSD